MGYMLSNCTKFGKNVTVKGRVFNPITGEGISVATIKLQREQASYDGGFKQSIQQQVMRTDIRAR